jgi:hypothetical protein
MSTVGLNTALYTRINRYAEILDEVLISLKSGTASPDGDGVRRLATTLASLGNNNDRTPESTLLGAVLGTGTNRLTDWAKISHDLLIGQATPDLIQHLEFLATTLEHERAAILAKMRGM